MFKPIDSLTEYKMYKLTHGDIIIKIDYFPIR